MADDTTPPDADEPRPRRKRADRDDEPSAGGRANRRDRRDDDEDDEEDWDERPRRRRRRREPEYDPGMNMVVPLNTSALAIAAGYLGLVSVLCVPAPFALLLGIPALRQLRTNRKLDGRYRAVFAVVMGAVFTTILVVAGGAVLVGEVRK
jgi:hypothetical protein